MVGVAGVRGHIPLPATRPPRREMCCGLPPLPYLLGVKADCRDAARVLKLHQAVRARNVPQAHVAVHGGREQEQRLRPRKVHHMGLTPKQDSVAQSRGQLRSLHDLVRSTTSLAGLPCSPCAHPCTCGAAWAQTGASHGARLTRHPHHHHLLRLMRCCLRRRHPPLHQHCRHLDRSPSRHALSPSGCQWTHHWQCQQPRPIWQRP